MFEMLSGMNPGEFSDTLYYLYNRDKIYYIAPLIYFKKIRSNLFIFIVSAYSSEPGMIIADCVKTHDYGSWFKKIRGRIGYFNLEDILDITDEFISRYSRILKLSYSKNVLEKLKNELEEKERKGRMKNKWLLK